MPQRVTLSNSKFDKALDREASRYYGLSIQLSLDGFSFCIFNPLKMKFLGIETYDFQHFYNQNLLCNGLNDLIPTVELLKLEYESVRILVETHKSTLVPEPYFDENNLADHLKLNHAIEHGEVPVNDYLPVLEARNVWIINENLLKTIKVLFPKASIHHHGSVLVESLLSSNKNSDQGTTVFVYVRKSWFDIAVINGNKLMFFNSFKYLEKEDFIYFLIYVLEQLDLNPELVQLTFLGEILKMSQIYDITNKYVRHVSFGSRPNEFSFSYVFDEIPGHFYFNLLNHYRCEL